MNTAVLRENTPRYEKLAKPRERIDRTSNQNAFNVKRGALSYQITESINRLAQPKKHPAENECSASHASIKSVPTVTGHQGHHKLINSNEQSRDAQESKKKKFLLDTYARITAARNKRCSKRLHELAKPKNFTPKANTNEDFENYFQTIKKYDKSPRQRDAIRNNV